jgi:hypothetical protein
VLAHLAPVLGSAPSGPTVRRALDLAGTPAMLDRIARARAKARAHAWKLIQDTPAGFPWLAIAGKTLTGWVVIDMDATLVTAHSDPWPRRRAARDALLPAPKHAPNTAAPPRPEPAWTRSCPGHPKDAPAIVPPVTSARVPARNLGSRKAGL